MRLPNLLLPGQVGGFIMREQQRKVMIKDTFNTVAGGYDNRALRFFLESAKHLAAHLDLKGHESVLDVATGTGYAALAIAKNLAQGHVTGIDFSAGMLAQARAKALAANIHNASFTEMDMQALDFQQHHFDAAVCAFGIFFVEDMESQLKHIADKVKPGGKIAFCGFYDDAFLPIVELFFNRIQHYGVEKPPLSWKRIATEDKAAELCYNAGLQDIRVEREDLGYYLQDASEWWDVIWYAGFRSLVNQIDPQMMEKFKQEHLAEVQNLATDKGIWLDVKVLYGIGVKP